MQRLDRRRIGMHRQRAESWPLEAAFTEATRPGEHERGSHQHPTGRRTRPTGMRPRFNVCALKAWDSVKRRERPGARSDKRTRAAGRIRSTQRTVHVGTHDGRPDEHVCDVCDQRRRQVDGKHTGHGPGPESITSV